MSALVDTTRPVTVTIRCSCGSVHKLAAAAPAYDTHWPSAAIPAGLYKRGKARRTVLADYVDEHAPRLAKRLAKVFNRMARDVAAEAERQLERRALHQAKSLTSVRLTKDDLVDAVLRELEVEGYEDDIVRAVRPLIEEAFKDAGLYGLEQVGVDVTAEQRRSLFEAAKVWAEQRAAELVGKKMVAGKLIDNPDSRWAISETTRDGLRSLITEAIDSGDSPHDLADAIEESFAFSESRAEMISRTEMAFAHVQGNVQGWRESGVVEMKQWILGDNHDDEDECDDAAEEGAIPLEEDFEMGEFGPPAHPNCVCALVPVVAEQAEEDTADEETA